jgi:hypothetical protein
LQRISGERQAATTLEAQHFFASSEVLSKGQVVDDQRDHRFQVWIAKTEGTANSEMKLPVSWVTRPESRSEATRGSLRAPQ